MATGDLVDLDTVKGYLGVQNSDDDKLLSGLITRCSSIAKNFMNRNILSAAYTETVSGKETASIVLRQAPITAVSSVTVNGVVIPLSADGIQPGFVFDDLSVSLIGFTFWRGKDNVQVSYTGGYSVVPDDIVEAVCELVSYRYKARQRLGEKSKALPQGGSVSFDTSALPDTVKSTLSNYRRMIPV